MTLVYVPDYQNVVTKNSQNENAKMTILTDLIIKLSFEPSKPKRLSPNMKNRSFLGLKTEEISKFLLKKYATYILSNSIKSW